MGRDPLTRLRRRLADVSVVGPLFQAELLRLSRRGTLIWLRCGYGLLLLTALFLAFRHWEAVYGQPPNGLDRRQLAWFGENFFNAFAFVQFWCAALFTPGYVAVAVAEERERRTADLLLASQLHNHEIVLGKLFARLAAVAGVLLTGLPVLALTTLFGGVDIVILMCEFAATGLTLLAVGSVAVACSATANSMPAALGRTYVMLAPLILFCLGTGIKHHDRVSPFRFLVSEFAIRRLGAPLPQDYE